MRQHYLFLRSSFTWGRKYSAFEILCNILIFRDYGNSSQSCQWYFSCYTTVKELHGTTNSTNSKYFFNTICVILTLTLPQLHVSVYAGRPPLCVYKIILYENTPVHLSGTRVGPNVNRKICCTVVGFISKEQFNLV